MQRLLLAAVIVVNVVSIAHHARANESKTTTKVDNHVFITTRTLPARALRILDVNTTRLTAPIPPNNCPTQNAFEVVTRRAGEAKCVRIDQ